MEKDFKSFTMKQDKNMSLTMITSLMSSTLRMEANVLLQFLCTCKLSFSFQIMVLHCVFCWILDGNLMVPFHFFLLMQFRC